MPRSRLSPKRALLQQTLADARRAAGLTQAELAIKLRRPQSFVSKYETGERRLDVVEFLEVTAAIGIDASKLLKTIAKAPE